MPEAPVFAAGANACEGVAALVLAAGHSRRFGADKRLAQWADGRPLLRVTLDSLTPCFSDTLVVLRHEDDAAARALPEGLARLNVPPQANGMGDSLAAGVDALIRSASECRALAVVLGDMPSVGADTFARLCARARCDNIVRPVQANRGGHPVLFGRHFWSELSALHGDDGARVLLKRHAARLVEMAVADDGIHRDIDRPEALP